MAMSQGELLWKRQQEAKRFLSRQQTKDCSLQTYINQAKASKQIFTPSPSAQNIQGSYTKGALEKGINNNTYQPTPVQACCSTEVTSGSQTINQQNRVAMKNAGAVICCEPDYSLFNGYAIDLSGQFVKGGVTYPLPNLVNTAKVPGALSCASCKKFYFPVPAQPALCSNCGTTYPQTSLYPPPPIDAQLRRYGDAGVPRVGGSTGLPTNLV